MPRCKLTKEKLARVPAMLAQGMDAGQIAQEFGVTVGTLRVVSCRYGITLRCKIPRKKREKSSQPDGNLVQELKLFYITLPARDASSITECAKRRGTDEPKLITSLLQIIVKDNLYQAVLDD